MRSIKQISKEEGIALDKVWYNRHQLLKELVKEGKTKIDKEIWKGALKAGKDMEVKYGKKNLKPMSDFEWGMLSGRLETLRWVLGEDWGMLDS